MRKVKQPIALTVSDVHLSHRTPLIRQAETNWYDVMRRQLDEIADVAEKYDIPILFAGDLFHTYNEPHELIEWFIRYAPFMNGVPGQHDLPYHNYEHKHRSAYGIIQAAEHLHNIEPGEPWKYYINKIPVYVHAFPWGATVKPCDRDATRELYTSDPEPNALHIALIHEYVWTKTTGYTGADPKKRVLRTKKKLDGYDFAVFGDNHIGFKSGNIVNNGTFIRRRKDEIDRVPCYSLLYSDGSIERKELRSAKDDKFLSMEEIELVDINQEIREFTKTLTGDMDNALDYKESVVGYCQTNQVKNEVKGVLLDALES